MHKNFLTYIVVLLVFGSLTYLVLEFGSHLQPGGTVPEKNAERPPILPFNPHKLQASASDTGKFLYKNLRNPLSILLLQIIIIITTARVIGSFFHKIGQPAVIGEMVAGILLGPSLLGLLSPEAQGFLFPATSLDILKLLSQIGVILFMFVVGIELDLQHLRQKAHTAVLVSHASIVVPFFLGTAFSLLIYRSLASPSISFSTFALFMGIAMSITAFPVLARIIKERGLSKSLLGNTAIACAAVDDVTAWCLLAVVVAAVKSRGLSSAMLTIFLALLFIGLMLFLLRPWLGRIIGEKIGNETGGKGLVAGVLTLTFTSALSTEVIGIHALFGAFLAGVVMPSQHNFHLFIRERLETFSSVFLLPIFFAFTGLRTQIGLLNDW